MSILRFGTNPRTCSFPDFDLVKNGRHKSPLQGFIGYQFFKRGKVFFLDQGDPRTAKPRSRQPGTETGLGSLPAFIQKIQFRTGNLIIVPEALMGLE